VTRCLHLEAASGIGQRSRWEVGTLAGSVVSVVGGAAVLSIALRGSSPHAALTSRLEYLCSF
jgi:hypothetical protein